jgi:hypothetical protein
MNQFKKFTFALAAVVALVVWAGTANAQVAFQMSSLVRDVRVEGISEAVGQVTLTSTTIGTIEGGSTLTLDYGVDIVGDDDDPDEVPDPAAPVSCPSCEGGFTFEIDGSDLIITFTADSVIAVGDFIVISGLRVDADAAGDGATINAHATATVPAAVAATQPITFFIVSTVPVATVEAAFDITIDSGKQILTCADNPEDIGGDPDPLDPDSGLAIVVTIAENFKQAFSSGADETGYANYDGTEENMQFTVTFKDVPADVTINLHEVNIDSDPIPGGLEVDGDFGATYDESDNTDGVLPEGFDGDDDDIEFTFEIVDTSSTKVEEMELIFLASTDEPIDSVNGAVSVDVGVSFEAGALEDQEVPEFVDNEVEDLGFEVTDCLTRLLLTWVVSNVAGYDTGVAIANTTEDDAAFGASDNQGAIAQAGTCKLTGYPSGGGSPVAFTTPSVAAGRTQAMVMSQTSGFSGFSGYVLVVCNFLNAHAFAFITNGFGSVAGPTLSQGYLANVVPAGTRVNANGESLSD